MTLRFIIFEAPALSALLDDPAQKPGKTLAHVYEDSAGRLVVGTRLVGPQTLNSVYHQPGTALRGEYKAGPLYRLSHGYLRKENALDYAHLEQLVRNTVAARPREKNPFTAQSLSAPAEKCKPGHPKKGEHTDHPIKWRISSKKDSCIRNKLLARMASASCLVEMEAMIDALNIVEWDRAGAEWTEGKGTFSVLVDNKIEGVTLLRLMQNVCRKDITNLNACAATLVHQIKVNGDVVTVDDLKQATTRPGTLPVDEIVKAVIEHFSTRDDAVLQVA
jgi:hypothetical protein